MDAAEAVMAEHVQVDDVFSVVASDEIRAYLTEY